MKGKLLLLIFASLFLLVVQSSFVSAGLCRGYDGYYHDCGCNNYPAQAGRSYLGYQPSYQSNYQSSYRYEYTSSYRTNSYNSYARNSYDSYNSYNSYSNLNYNSRDGFYRSMYEREPVRDRPTYYVYTNTHRSY